MCVCVCACCPAHEKIMCCVCFQTHLPVHFNTVTYQTLLLCMHVRARVSARACLHGSYDACRTCCSAEAAAQQHPSHNACIGMESVVAWHAEMMRGCKNREINSVLCLLPTVHVCNAEQHALQQFMHSYGTKGSLACSDDAWMQKQRDEFSLVLRCVGDTCACLCSGDVQGRQAQARGACSRRACQHSDVLAPSPRGARQLLPVQACAQHHFGQPQHPCVRDHCSD